MDCSPVPPRLARALCAAVASSLAITGAAHAQRAPSSAPAATVSDRGAFVTLSRTDTVTVERFTRTAAGVDATLSVHGGGRLHHVITYAPRGGRVARYVTEFFPADSAANAKPAQRATYAFAGDTMSANVSDQPMGYKLVVRPGALPWQNRSVMLLEEIARRARSAGGTRVEVPVVSVADGQQLAVVVTTVGRDSLSLSFGGTPILLAVDAQGRVLGGRIPSQGVTIVRTGSAAGGVGAIGREGGAASQHAGR